MVEDFRKEAEVGMLNAGGIEYIILFFCGLY